MAIEIIGENDNPLNVEDPNQEAQTPSGAVGVPDVGGAEMPDGGTDEPVAGVTEQEPPEDPMEDPTEDPQGEQSKGKDADPDKEKEDPEAGEFFVGDTEVEVTVPDDIRSELTDKGLDVDQIVKEMYSKGGNGRPSEDTMGKLYELYGKFSVDSYFNALEVQNRNTLETQSREEEDLAKAEEARFDECVEMLGGQEVWDSLESFALDTLSDEELNDFNEVMQSGLPFAQNLALVDLKAKMGQAKGDSPEGLMTPDSASQESEGVSSPLSKSDYLREVGVLSEKYRYDPKGFNKASKELDARRRLGMQRGL